MFIIQSMRGLYVGSVTFRRDSVLDIHQCGVTYCLYPENALLFTTREHAQALRDLLPDSSDVGHYYRVVKAPSWAPR